MLLYEFGLNVFLIPPQLESRHLILLTHACSPVEHAMKWSGSVDSPWVGVRDGPAVCHSASWDLEEMLISFLLLP